MTELVRCNKTRLELTTLYMMMEHKSNRINSWKKTVRVQSSKEIHGEPSRRSGAIHNRIAMSPGFVFTIVTVVFRMKHGKNVNKSFLETKIIWLTSDS